MLRNRQEKEQNLIKGVNLVANPTKLELGYFTSLANWIPSKKYKIKKKRGPARLSTDPQTVDPITLGFGTLVDCSTTTPPGVVGTCDGCLTVDTDGTLIAKSAALTVPCFCFYAPQICSNGVITVQITFKAIIAGSPISGPVLMVPPSATDTSFSGYALIYDPGHATQKLKIVEWNTATLAALGTIKSSANTTLIADDVIKLTYDTSTGALKAYINDVLQSSLNVTDLTLNDSANMGIGIVVIGTSGADDRMRWDGLAGSCAGTTIPPTCSVPTFELVDFVFGMNSFTGTAQPVDWVTSADWIIPAGSIICGSCDPGITANIPRADIFDDCNPPAPVCIDVDFAGADTCVLSAPGAIQNVQEQMVASFVEEVGQGISGIALLDSGATVAIVTGYGLIIDRVDGTAKFVQWEGNDLETFTILHSEAYVPLAGDILKIIVPASPYPDTTYFITPTIVNSISEIVFPLEIFDSPELTQGIALALTDGAIVTIPSGVDDSTITFELVVSGIIASSIC